MAPHLHLRTMTPADLPFAHALRGAVGWNQTVADWQRFLLLEPEGCFIAELQGNPVGTATTIIHGRDLAWIGMVLVTSEFRRQGIGRALLLHAINHLRKYGIRCIKLDATPLGRPVYESLGFQVEWSLSRWERPERVPRSADSGNSVPTQGAACRECAPEPFVTPGSGSVPITSQAAGRNHALQEEDLSTTGSLHALETDAFGTPRNRLLEALSRQSRVFLHRDNSSGTVLGYGFLRPGSVADYFGPAVARSTRVAESILRSLVERHDGRRLFWDIPEPNRTALQWATEHGFHRQRDLTRMFLGENASPGDPRLQLALSGPETG